MLPMLAIIYIGIGVLILGYLLCNEEVRADAKTWEPMDLLGFMVFMVLTWPSVFIGEE